MIITDLKITEDHIQTLLNAKYASNSKYKVGNVYVFKRDWESDFFVQKENGYCYEFEIKISRSDFLADFKKSRKHDIIKTGKYFDGRHDRDHNLRPNKFFYVAPSGLLSISDIPEYAGLITVDGYYLKTVKDAPFIHKEKLKFENALCNKFYYYWMEQKRQTNELKREVKRLSSILESKK